METDDLLGVSNFSSKSPWEYLDRKRSNINKKHISPDATIHNTANIRGNVVIEDDANIGPFTTIRDGSYIGENVTIGHGSEVARSVFLQGSGAYHQNYVGDSVVGVNASLSAGVVVAVHRLDENDIKELERKRAGVIVGKKSTVGINTSLNCGVIVEQDSIVPPNTFVKHHWPE